MDPEIQAAQRRVCDALGLDVATLWQWRPDNPWMLTLTHLYRPLGGPPVTQTMDAQDYFPWCQRQVLAGKTVAVSSLADLPAEAARDREVWDHYDIKSALRIPVSVGGDRVFGSVNFNDTRTERRWSEALVQRLQLVAQIFANALARKDADQALRESEARLSLAADAAAVGLWSLNLATDRFWLTDMTRELFAFTPSEEVTFERFLGLVHPDDQPSVRETVRTMVQSRSEGQMQYRAVRPDGRVRWMLSRGRVRCGSSGEPKYLMGVTLDITERKQTEGRMQDLSRRLIRAHEAERARLARELHDDLTQRLARLAIDAGRVEPAAVGTLAAETVRSIREGLVQLSEDIHALSYRLHPSVLEDLGLVEALKAECERFAQREGVRVDVDLLKPPAIVPLDPALCLFRVAQEALQNVVRHARARTVQVSLRVLDDGLQLAVHDDGIGFLPALQQARPSLGLASMRERIALLEGELDIETAPGQGTTIVAWVPLKGPSA
ncbi:MAG: PAS domain-containing protein [Verrucomicrobiae bacterium]|nr:PAS domain-containing protein [Verrucomicrobiae bacterium]